MTIFYRILSAIINIGALLFACSLLVLLPLSLAAPPLWLPVFILLAILLYTWNSRKFRYKVLLKNEPVKHSLRDWIRVNGFVAIIFSVFNIPSTISIIISPYKFTESMQEMVKQFGNKFEQNLQPETLRTVSIIMLVYFVALLIHVVWTFSLLKKYKEHFQ
jgi:membrane protease YdiL (CAAX protease family)